MKTILKGCLIIIAILVLAIIAIIAFWIISSNNKIKQSEIDSAEQSIICDTVPYVVEQPEIAFSNFQSYEIDTLKFQILRAGKLIQDTIVCDDFNYISDKGNYRTMKIPYNYFLKSDTIVVSTKYPLYYKISDYHHYAYLHYGMFGYLGNSDCRFSNNCVVNNREHTYHGVLSKYEGWKSLDSIPDRIYKNTHAFEALDRKVPVKYDKAHSIFVEHTRYASPIFLYYENGFYYFEDSRSKIKKINAYTGEFTDLDDYPL